MACGQRSVLGKLVRGEGAGVSVGCRSHCSPLQPPPPRPPRWPNRLPRSHSRFATAILTPFPRGWTPNPPCPRVEDFPPQKGAHVRTPGSTPSALMPPPHVTFRRVAVSLRALDSGECLPCARPARYFYYDFPRFNPQVHHYQMKPRAGECDDSRVGERPQTGLPSTRGSKGTFGGRQLRELMGMVVETEDWGYKRRWSPWGIDD